jgi:hypothetical protein
MPDPMPIDPNMLSEPDRQRFLKANEESISENMRNENLPLKVPEGKFASPERDLELKRNVAAFLQTPERLKHEESNLPIQLGSFLVEKGFIRSIDVWRGSWGFKYEDKKVYLSDTPMPEAAYNYFIFRLGKDNKTGQPLYPSKSESDQYRFLHETCHAYQDFLTSTESSDNPDLWYDKAHKNNIDSTYAILFNYCLNKRLNSQGKGLSTWGNISDYNNYEAATQQVARAIEDANELVTMYLWNPRYFETFLDYVAGDIPGFSENDLVNDGLTKISKSEKENLKKLIQMYVEEMRDYTSQTVKQNF